MKLHQIIVGLSFILISQTVDAQTSPCSGHVNAGSGVDVLNFHRDDPNFDNHDAIQQAIDCAEDLGTFVNFPDGNLYTTGGIMLKTSICGKNTTLTVINESPLTFTYLFAINKPNASIKISGIEFDGNSTALNVPNTALTENYLGLREYSLIQSWIGGKELIVENCTFRNTVDGAIALDPVANGLAGRSSTDSANVPGVYNSYETVKIVNCLFENIGTECAYIFNSGSSVVEGQQKELDLTGTVLIKDNIIKDAGTIYPNGTLIGGNLQTGFGNAFITGNVHSMRASGNFFENTARYDLKHGAVKNIHITNNYTSNPNWGFVQTNCIEMFSNGYILGDIVVQNNTLQVTKGLAANNIGSQFGQFRGTTSNDQSLLRTMYRNLIVKGNNLNYHSPFAGTMDAIQINLKPKFERIEVSNNTITSSRRAAIAFANDDVDEGWQGEDFVVRNNSLRSDSVTLTRQGLLIAINNTSLDPNYKRLIVKGNLVEGVNAGIYFEDGINMASSYFIEDNNFLSAANPVVWVNDPPLNSIEELMITNNYFNNNLRMGMRSTLNQDLIQDILVSSGAVVIVKGNGYKSAQILYNTFNGLGLTQGVGTINGVVD